MAIVSLVSFRRPVVARAAAVLLPAGAWDVAPTEMIVSWAGSATLYFYYQAAGAGGAFRWRIEVTAEDPAAVWCRSSIYEAAVFVPGTDSVGLVQREEFQYQATGLTQEAFVVGPASMSDGARWLRIGAAESGNLAAPGMLAIQVMLGK